jgi:hypothetical protein
MERSYALLWVGSGGDPDDFPGAVDAKSSLGPGRLRAILSYLFRSAAIGDDGFWERIGSYVSEDDLLSLGDVPANANLSSLVQAKLPELKMVSVAASTVTPRVSTPEWSLLDGALRIRAEDGMLDFVRDGRKHNRLPASYNALSLEAVGKRADGLRVESIEVDSDTLAVTFGAKGTGSVIDDEWFANISQVDGFNLVNTVLVRLPSGGRLRCDLRRGVATMEGTKMRSIPDLGSVAARLLPPLSTAARAELVKMLGLDDPQSDSQSSPEHQRPEPDGTSALQSEDLPPSEGT